MKRNAIVGGVVSLLMGLMFFVACDDNDDDYSLDKYYQSIVTVQGDESGAYWLKLVNGDLLWPVNQGWLPYYGSERGARGLATYNIVGGQDGQFTNLIRLISLSGILTKDVWDWTAANKDTVVLENWNPGVIDEAWIEKGDTVNYINVIFQYRAHKSVIHYINLIQDNLNTEVVNPTGGVWSLKFCQNSNGDWVEHGSKYRTLVSFIIPKDINLSTLTKINIDFKDWKEATQVYTINVKSSSSTTFSASEVKEFEEGIQGME